MNYFFIFSIGFLSSILLIPPFIRVARHFKILDYPSDRKIQQEPVPYLGGLAVLISFLITLAGSAYFFDELKVQDALNLAIASLVISALGLYDDIRGVRPLFKILIQLLAAIFLVSEGINLDTMMHPFKNEIIELGYWGEAFSVLWLVGISNAVNLMDGMDGLAGGTTVISLLFLFFFSITGGNLTLAILACCLMASVSGFLIFNMPPAKIYLGDTGSLFIGFVLGAFCLIADARGPAAMTVMIPAILLILPILDTSLAILRRWRKKLSFATADKQHLHHRLLLLSGSTYKALAILYSANIFLGLMAVVAFFLPADYRFFLAIFLLYNLAVGLIILHLSESRFRWRARALDTKLDS